MQFPVVIQKLSGSGLRAKTLAPPPLSVEGPTREAVLASLREQLIEYFDGWEFVTIDVPIRGEDTAHDHS